VAGHRVERDTMGAVRVPADALWGAQTQRALENFPVSGLRMPARFVAALGLVKAACADADRSLPAHFRRAIRNASLEVAEGRHDGQFPLDVFQTGSGTSTNMNANEVIARLASRALGRPVHPNDDVNRGQSSNDVIPSAAHVAALLAIRDGLSPSLLALQRSLERKSREWKAAVKLGRTHLMDAMPVTLGQEFGGYAAQVRKGREGVERAAEGLRELAIGGTAVGTGVNAPPAFGRRVCASLRRRLGIPFREARDRFEAQGARDDLARVSGGLRSLAGALTKIANDIRWMGSGPEAGLGELALPGLQPGSSIMPGKTNPVMCEMLVQVAAQVLGNDATVALAAQGGHFELNAMVPVIVHNVLQSIEILSTACRLFAARCVDGLRANEDRLRALVERNAVSATVLTPKLGYARVAELVNEARRRGVSVKALAVERGLVTPREAERLFDPRRLTGEASRS